MIQCAPRRCLTFLYFFGMVVDSIRSEDIPLSPCTVCVNGEKMALPDNSLEFFNNRFLDTCAQLEVVVAGLHSSDKFCRLAQSVGPHCGCPVDQETTCSLCHDGSDVAYPSKALTDFVEPSDVFPNGVTNTFNVTCGMLQDVLHTEDKTAPICTERQQDFHRICGCQGEPPDLNDSGLVNQTIEEPPQEPEPSCSLCANGENVPFSDMPFSAGDLPATTCREAQSLIATLYDEDDVDCKGSQLLGHLCGCSEPDYVTNCYMCPNGEPIPDPNRRLHWFDKIVDLLPVPFQPFASNLTCQLLEAIVLYEPPYVVEKTDPDFICLAVQLKSGYCGCSPDWRPLFLTWAYRITGSLSLLGSLIILFHVLTSRKRSTAYHQIMVGISFFDCISSLAYALVGVMAPVDDGFFQSKGNQTTCSIQGFMIQLGLTSIFYNLCLSVYFFLVINYNWKERDLRKYLPYAHAMLVIVGLSMASAAIPFYGAQFGTCYLLDAPFVATSWEVVTFFFGLPVSAVIVAVTLLTVGICFKVYKVQKSSKKWAACGTMMQLTRRVVWQSFLYVAAFYVTLPFVMLSYYIKFAEGSSFWIFAVASVMAPSQGILNAMIYFQRTKQDATDNFAKLLAAQAKRLSSGIVNVWRHHSKDTISASSPYLEDGGTDFNKQKISLSHQHLIEAVIRSQGQESTHPRLQEEPSSSSPSRCGDPSTRSSINKFSSIEYVPSGETTFGENSENIRDLLYLSEKELLEDDVSIAEPHEFEATMEYWRLNHLDQPEEEQNPTRKRILQFLNISLVGLDNTPQVSEDVQHVTHRHAYAPDNSPTKDCTQLSGESANQEINQRCNDLASATKVSSETQNDERSAHEVTVHRESTSSRLWNSWS